MSRPAGEVPPAGRDREGVSRILERLLQLWLALLVLEGMLAVRAGGGNGLPAASWATGIAASLAGGFLLAFRERDRKAALECLGLALLGILLLLLEARLLPCWLGRP